MHLFLLSFLWFKTMQTARCVGGTISNTISSSSFIRRHVSTNDPIVFVYRKYLYIFVVSELESDNVFLCLLLFQHFGMTDQIFVIKWVSNYYWLIIYTLSLTHFITWSMVCKHDDVFVVLLLQHLHLLQRFFRHVINRLICTEMYIYMTVEYMTSLLPWWLS